MRNPVNHPVYNRHVAEEQRSEAIWQQIREKRLEAMEKPPPYFFTVIIIGLVVISFIARYI